MKNALDDFDLSNMIDLSKTPAFMFKNVQGEYLFNGGKKGMNLLHSDDWKKSDDSYGIPVMFESRKDAEFVLDQFSKSSDPNYSNLQIYTVYLNKEEYELQKDCFSKLK